MTKRDVYIAKMKLQLDELNVSMGKLEVYAIEAKEDAREKYKEEMVKLRYQSDLALGKLDDLKSTSEEAWESMVTEMEKVRDAFTHSFRDFKSRL